LADCGGGEQEAGGNGRRHSFSSKKILSFGGYPRAEQRGGGKRDEGTITVYRGGRPSCAQIPTVAFWELVYRMVSLSVNSSTWGSGLGAVSTKGHKRRPIGGKDLRQVNLGA